MAANLKQKSNYMKMQLCNESASCNLKLISNDGSVVPSLETLTANKSVLYFLHEQVKIMLVLKRFVCVIEMKTTFLAQVQHNLIYLSSKTGAFSDSVSWALFLTYYIWFEQFFK